MMTIFLSESMCKNYVQTLCLQVMTFQREKLGRKNFSEKGMKSVVGDRALVGLLGRAHGIAWPTKVRWGPIVAVVGPANSNSRKQKLAAHGLALAWPAAAYSDEELVDGP